MSATNHSPSIVSWNITTACNLRCPHCYIDAGARGEGELSTAEALHVVDQLVDAGTELLIVTGGEPTMRRDLFAITKYAAEREIFVVLGTNGTLADAEAAMAARGAGIRGVGISIDSMDPAKHDQFRGSSGAWQRAVDGMNEYRRAGLEVAVQMSVLPMNFVEIDGVCDFAHQSGALAFNAYFLVCTGRGEDMTNLGADQYELALEKLLDAQERYPDMLVRAKCAPHGKRLAYERAARGNPSASSRPGAAGMLASAGCPAGRSYARVTPGGDVTACPYLPDVLGNLRERRFAEIWRDSSQLNALRSLELRGRCGECGFKELCTGCRARALATEGDILGEDPYCSYEPGRIGEAAPFPDSGPVVLTDDAVARLGRIPGFLRSRLKRGLEAYARSRGMTEITPELMKEMRRGAARFGNKIPGAGTRRDRDV